MLLRSLSNACLRVAFAVSLTAFTTPIASHEAAAAKGVKRFGAAASGVVAGRAAAESMRDRAGEPGAAADSEPADGDIKPAEASAANEAQTPARALAVKPLHVAPAARRDIDVAGCAPGKICIVCLAGCNNDANEIVHSMPKGLRAD